MESGKPHKIRLRDSESICVYKREGAKCLNEKTRGRKLGEKRQLSPEQEKEIQSILIDRHPDQLKLNFILWIRATVCELIYGKYGITITLRNMSEYLKRWGMTCQRLIRKAYFQDNVKLNTFMHETYPGIVEKARKENAEIYWGDEIGNYSLNQNLTNNLLLYTFNVSYCVTKPSG